MRPESGAQPTQRLGAPISTAPVRPPGHPGQPAKPIKIAKVRKKRPIKRILLIVLAVLVVYVVAVATVFATNVTKVDALPANSSVTSSGTNYLLVGSDSRDGLTAKQQKQLNTGSTGGNRTDTIMIMHVPMLGAPTLVSLPRDSWVGIPGYGEGKINSAYAYGGPQLLTQTVEEATGLQIDHFVEIGFAGVAQTTDALGGVTLCPTQRYDDANSGLKVKKGCQRMDGATSLAYVRMRYADPRGDLGRVERQQEFMSAVAKRAMSPATWLLPWRAFGAANAAGESLTVSSGTGIVDDMRMAMAMGMISMGFGEATTVPTIPGTYFVGGQDAVKWDTPAALELFNSID